MRVHRRGFIAALFAPFVARFLPKEQPPGRKDFIESKEWFRIETRPSDYYEVAPSPGLYGLEYYAVPSNLGNFMGIPRASNYIGSSERFKKVLECQAMPYHIERVRPPGSLQRYMEAERAIHA